MKNANKIEKLIYSMLTENTGSHFLDSGGASNRSWQKNGKKSLKDFQNEPAVSYYLNTESKYKDIERTVSVFHYLQSFYELDSICDKFNRINKNCTNWDSDLYGVSDKGQKFLDLVTENKASRYAIGYDRSWNTYNGESDLSQVLQGTDIKINGESYVLIQIHNGADVRGGYTDAKLFKFNDWGDYIQEYLSTDEIISQELEYITVLDQNENVIELEQLNEIFDLV
jgi:hypothetical protein